MALVDEMNQELDLYVPADIHDEFEISSYENLFLKLRQLYFLYKRISLEEVRQYFVDFYNAGSTDKSGIINKLDALLSDAEQKDEEIQEMLKPLTAYRIALMTEGMNIEDQAKTLYRLENNTEPQSESDLAPYIQALSLPQEEIDNLDDQILATEQEELVDPNYKSLTAQQVAAKYLRGAGAYDPSKRNTGFRIDGKNSN